MIAFGVLRRTPWPISFNPNQTNIVVMVSRWHKRAQRHDESYLIDCAPALKKIALKLQQLKDQSPVVCALESATAFSERIMKTEVSIVLIN